jgi:hypothetical protein
MGVTGTGSTRWQQYNWHGWVLLLVVGGRSVLMMMMPMQDEIMIFLLVVVSCFWGCSYKQPPVTHSKTIQINEYLN